MKKLKIVMLGTGYRPSKRPSPRSLKRLRESFQKMQEASAKDCMDAQKRPSGLPRDWRSRLIRAGARL